MVVSGFGTSVHGTDKGLAPEIEDWLAGWGQPMGRGAVNWMGMGWSVWDNGLVHWIGVSPWDEARPLDGEWGLAWDEGQSMGWNRETT